MTRFPRLCIVAGLLFSMGGCRTSSSTSVYTPPVEPARNPLRAHQLTLEAADHVTSDPERAERLLREALGCDLFHGPAHNNLGVILLARGQLYEAANEFEWARKLMPGHPDPRINLALVFEQAGRVDDALASYRSAAEVHPGHLPAIQGLARLQIRFRREDQETDVLLSDIEFRSEDPAWRSWAERERIRRQAIPGT